MTKNWDAEPDDKLLACIAQCKNEAWREAFVVFYNRHQDYLYGICYNLANRYKFGFFDEDDAFQLTMEKVREHAGTFNPGVVTDAQELEHKVDGWLGGIAENVVYDLIRRKPNCVPLIYENPDDNESDTNGVEKNEFEVSAPVELEENKKTIYVREAIETLSPNEQAVVWATSQFFQCRENQHTPKKELDEIVKGLGISKAYYRKIRERARNKIKIYLADKKSKMQTK